MMINKRTLKKAEIISFDIFDTLLKRNVPSPEKIFDIVEEISGVTGFATIRKEAAELAKKNNLYEEPTYDQIYEYIKFDSKEKKEYLKEIELKIEEKFLQTNYDIKPLYDWCVRNNKQIIAVSDMYLTSDFLKNILEKNGFKVEKVFVSCEEQANKRSGKLFQIVSKKIKSKNIVHIGDSWKSDYIEAKKSGWKAIHYKKTVKKNIIDCMVKNNPKEDYFINLGFSVLGPMLYSFSKWLVKKSENIDVFLFFSRDGLIMKKAYEILKDSKNYYIYVSRKSLMTATLWMQPEFETLKDIITITDHFTIRTFIKKLGLEEEQLPLDSLNINLKKEYGVREFWINADVKKLYEKIKPIVIENSRKQYTYFFNYIEPYIKNGEKIGIVDIGWKATMQTHFVKLLKSNTKYNECSVHGFYLGVEKDTDDVDGFLYKSRQQTTFKTAIDAGYGLIETFFLAREGTTLRYSATGPVKDVYEVTDETEKINLENIHIGALRFVEQISNLTEKINYEPTALDAFRYFEKLVYSPKTKDLKILGIIPFHDFESMQMISNEGIRKYIVSPKSFIVDYHNAPWKIGFLKQNISKLIPWGMIYKKIKNV